jgi:hypothetical protein
MVASSGLLALRQILQSFQWEERKTRLVESQRPDPTTALGCQSLGVYERHEPNKRIYGNIDERGVRECGRGFTSGALWVLSKAVGANVRDSTYQTARNQTLAAA